MKRERQGFSMIELMVSMLMLGAAAAFIPTALHPFQKFDRDHGNTGMAFQSAQVLLQALERDFSVAQVSTWDATSQNLTLQFPTLGPTGDSTNLRTVVYSRVTKDCSKDFGAGAQCQSIRRQVDSGSAEEVAVVAGVEWCLQSDSSTSPSSSCSPIVAGLPAVNSARPRLVVLASRFLGGSASKVHQLAVFHRESGTWNSAATRGVTFLRGELK